MVKCMITIIKKELYRFFADKKMMISILLPGILIYVMYSLVAANIGNRDLSLNNSPISVYCVNTPQIINEISSEYNIKYTTISESYILTAKEMIEREDLDLLLIFPENFDSLSYMWTSIGSSELTKTPNLEIYYNSNFEKSLVAYTVFNDYFKYYKAQFVSIFDINAGKNTTYDLASSQKKSVDIIASIMPMMAIIFLLNGCLACTTESIAGEKERGTLAKLLILPIKRSWIAIGKLFSLSLIGLICGFSTLIGLILSLPKITEALYINTDLSVNIYKISDYFLLLLVIISTTFLFVGVLIIISCFSKSTKEANVMSAPLIILTMAFSANSIFGTPSGENIIYFFIPVYNSLLSMYNIFSAEYSVLDIILVMFINVLYTLFLLQLISKLLNKETIVYNH